MRLLSRFILMVIANSLALLVSGYFLTGFILNTDPKNILVLSAVLSLINLLLKPVVKLILSPFIILTLGLLIFIINAATLYLLDFLSPDLTINTISDLLLPTLIFSALNFIISRSAKKAYRQHDY